MLEARLVEGSILKKVIEAIKEMVTSANFDCTSAGISFQAMDSSHVSLVTFLLEGDGFETYRCDRNISLGINIESLTKILKCAGNEDMITLNAKDGGDTLSLMFEHPKQTRISHFSLKLMDIDSEHLGIPDGKYKCTVKMPSEEFQRICKDMAVLGDSVHISITKEGVKFSATGEMGNGSIVCKQDCGEEEQGDSVIIKLEQKMSGMYALRYLSAFAKATSLSKFVTLKMSPDAPLVVEYQIAKSPMEKKKNTKKMQTGQERPEEIGYVRYYLAPKIEEDAPETHKERLEE